MSTIYPPSSGVSKQSSNLKISPTLKSHDAHLSWTDFNDAKNQGDGQVSNRINFQEVKALMRGYERALLYRLLPQGKRRGHEYIALNPRRNDSKLGSFSINLHSFKWADFATGDRGGDIISLWAYVRGINNLQAAKEILAVLGRN